MVCSIKSVKSLEKFEKVSRERYWNESIRSGMMTDIEAEKWSREKKSRVEYAKYVFNRIRELEVSITEKEIPAKIPRHLYDSTALEMRM